MNKIMLGSVQETHRISENDRRIRLMQIRERDEENEMTKRQS